MEASSLSRQGLSQLLNETNDCIQRMDQSQSKLMSALVEMSPQFNLNQSKFIPNTNWEISWKLWKQELEVFFQALAQAQEAYQDLSSQLHALLAGRTPQDPLYQGLASQGAALLKDLQRRQEFALLIEDLSKVLNTLAQQGNITSTIKQKIEDLVFRLHVLF